MTATPTTDTSGLLDVGDTWLMGLEVYADAEPGQAGPLVDADVVITVTRPDSTTATPAVESGGTGRYYASYVLGLPGRHFAVAAVSGTVVDVVTYAVDAAAPGTPPDLPALKAYLGTSVSSWSDDELTRTLAVEQEAQAEVCRIGAVFPGSLYEALLRRVARNLFMRGLPAGTQSADGVVTRVGSDSEINRLEGPRRRFVIG